MPTVTLMHTEHPKMELANTEGATEKVGPAS